MSEPLSFEKMKIGMRVRCIYGSPNNGRYGQIGRVVAIRQNAPSGRVVVEWEDKYPISIRWTYASSFEAVREPKKFSYVSPKKLRKLEREQMKAKAFLNQ